MVKQKTGKAKIDNGNFSRISNEILEELAKFRLSPLESSVLFILIRQSYGYQREKTQPIGYQYIADACRMKRQNAYKAVKKLLDKRIVIAHPVGKGKRNWYQFEINNIYGYWDYQKQLEQQYLKLFLKSDL